MNIPDEPGYYQLPMDHPIAIENVRRHSSKAQCVENIVCLFITYTNTTFAITILFKLET